MMKKVFFPIAPFLSLLLFSIQLMGQTPALAVKINSVIVDNANPKFRAYQINYQIENLTNHPVSFFLIPTHMTCNAMSSLALTPIYKLYQNNIYVPMQGPLEAPPGKHVWTDYPDENISNVEDAQALIQKITMEKNKAIVEAYQKKGGKSDDVYWIIKNQELLDSKILMKALETQSYTITVQWNKERYRMEDDLEYYLEEQDVFEMDLTLHLIKTYFKDRLTAEEYAEVAKDPNFIEGIFTSNKVTIDFN